MSNVFGYTIPNPERSVGHEFHGVFNGTVLDDLGGSSIIEEDHFEFLSLGVVGEPGDEGPGPVTGGVRQ